MEFTTHELSNVSLHASSFAEHEEVTDHDLMRSPHLMHFRSKEELFDGSPNAETEGELWCVEDPTDFARLGFQPHLVKQINASAWNMLSKKKYHDQPVVDESDEDLEWKMPWEFFRCENVNELIVDRNHLHTMPREILRLENLTHLNW